MRKKLNVYVQLKKCKMRIQFITNKEVKEDVIRISNRPFIHFYFSLLKMILKQDWNIFGWFVQRFEAVNYNKDSTE